MLIADLDQVADAELAGILLSLQRAAYRVEAALIGDDRIPPLHEKLDDLRAQPLRWLGAFEDGQLVGAIAWTESDGTCDIDRLVVAPGSHRRGVGSALVGAVISRPGLHRKCIEVSTGRDNGPARALYAQFGFAHVGRSRSHPRAVGQPVRAERGRERQVCAGQTVSGCWGDRTIIRPVRYTTSALPAAKAPVV